jgi:hypothetical protein
LQSLTSKSMVRSLLLNVKHDGKSMKTEWISVRVLPTTKRAIDKAAKDDQRSVAGLVDKILVEWLDEHGYLTKYAK